MFSRLAGGSCQPPLAGESVRKELSQIFWERSVSASERGPPPSLSIVSSEIIDKDALGGNWGSSSITEEPNHGDFRSAGPLAPAFPEGWRGRGSAPRPPRLDIGPCRSGY